MAEYFANDVIPGFLTGGPRLELGSVIVGDFDLSDRGCAHGIAVRGCTFRGFVDLQNARFPGGLLLDGCTFASGLRLADAYVAGPLSLRDVTIQLPESLPESLPEPLRSAGIDFQRLRVDGQLDGARLTAHGKLNLAGAAVGSNLWLCSADVYGELNGFYLSIGGELGLFPAPESPERRTHIRGAATLRCARVGGRVNARGVRIDRGIFLSGARIDDGCLFTPATFTDSAGATQPLRVEVVGPVDLRAKIGGQVDFTGASVRAGEGQIAVNLEGADIGGSVFFWADESTKVRTEITGRIDLRAKIGRSVEFKAASLKVGEGQIAVNFEGADVGGSALFWSDASTKTRTEITGRIDLRAKIGGQVSFEGTSVKAGEGQIAVEFEHADIGGSVFFWTDESAKTRTEIIGRIGLRAKIGGQVSFEGTSVKAREGQIAVNFGQAVIGGSVFFWTDESTKTRTEITGRIDLRAKIGGQVYFKGASVKAGEGQVAVDLEGAELGGSVFFRTDASTKTRTEITGRVDLRAKIGGQVCFEGASVKAAEGQIAVSLEGADVTGPIFLLRDESGRMNDISGPLWLYGVRCRNLKIHGLALAGALDMPYANIRHEVSALDLTATRWSLLHATIGGDLSIASASLVGSTAVPGASSQPALDLRHAKIGGRVLAAEDAARRNTFGGRIDLQAARIEGDVRFLGSEIAGDLALEDAHINGELNLGAATIAGDLLMRSARVRGRVFADESDASGPYPQVRGRVDARSAQLADVHMKLVRSQGEKPAIIPTKVDLSSAQVGDLVLAGDALPDEFLTEGLAFGTLNADELALADKRALAEKLTPANMLPRAVPVDRWLRSLDLPSLSWRDLIRFGVWLLLNLWIAVNLSPARQGLTAFWVLYLNILVVGALVARRKPKNALLHLLERMQPFNRSFHVAVEDWKRRGGDELLADEIFLWRRRRELGPIRPRAARSASTSERQVAPVDAQVVPSERSSTRLYAWRQLLDLAFGYGVRVRRAVHVYALIGLANVAVFSAPGAVENTVVFVSRDAPARIGAPMQAWDNRTRPAPEPDSWGLNEGFWMAMRLQVPVVSLFATDEWEPAQRPSRFFGWSYDAYASLVILVNVVLLPLIVAGAAGFLKRQS